MAADTGNKGDDFWADKWETGNTSWHKDCVNPLLQKYYSFLTLDGARMNLDVFVPLCGKTLDMIWLADQGACVVGCDLSDLAAQQFFAENALQFTKVSTEKFTIYKATDKRITFMVGSIYDITPHDTGPFDVMWDCNSFTAINIEDRPKYYAVSRSLLRPSSRILIVGYNYDASLRTGPPRSVTLDIVEASYGHDYDISLLESIDMTGSPLLERFNLPWAFNNIFSLKEK